MTDFVSTFLGSHDITKDVSFSRGVRTMFKGSLAGCSISYVKITPFFENPFLAREDKENSLFVSKEHNISMAYLT
ncbi:hypothetical protein NY2A_b698L [Paramecium bursaria Chlorella virus NY2A]|uniref:Uncharacterized protein b698L n=2 Tax=Chlorovirus TaxID=181083 RepID=A7IXM3_PBCVN|nr:hypothetical protein NY2A_b698L [Paramecium bursaria Chlorella virus NY2A]ABT15097.1 hypothetical protein NY2A_b698L [Paramecium bursaria Chlorella virus NY2A]